MSEQEIILSVILTTLLILLLLAGITISLFAVGRQQSRQKMELAQARFNYEKELRKVELEVSEQLTQHFARELHDNIGHNLACIRLELENRKLDYPQFEHIFSPFDKFLEDASQQLRLLSRSMNTDYISQNGLLVAMNIEVERHKQLRKFDIIWERDDYSVPLDKNQELIAFRIFQEIMHNAIRHSKARRLYIKLYSLPSFLLSVTDDGIGFSLDETLNTSQASGIRNIIKRAVLAGIECNIKASPGCGCTYRLSVSSPKADSEENLQTQLY